MKRLTLAIGILLILSCASLEGNKSAGNILNKIGDNVIPENANTIELKSIPDPENSDKGDRLLIKIKDLLIKDGRLAVYNSPGSDLVLSGAITSFFIQGITFDAAQVPITKRIRITISLKLYDRQKKKLIFLEKDIQAYLNYSEKINPVKTDMQAEEEVLDLLAQRIASKILSGWYTEYMSNIERGNK